MKMTGKALRIVLFCISTTVSLLSIVSFSLFTHNIFDIITFNDQIGFIIVIDILLVVSLFFYAMLSQKRWVLFTILSLNELHWVWETAVCIPRIIGLFQEGWISTKQGLPICCVLIINCILFSSFLIGSALSSIRLRIDVEAGKFKKYDCSQIDR